MNQFFSIGTGEMPHDVSATAKATWSSSARETQGNPDAWNAFLPDGIHVAFHSASPSVSPILWYSRMSVDPYYLDMLYVCAFCALALGLPVGIFATVHLLAARETRNYANKTGQYIECGIEPIGDAWIRYSAVYYLYALVFVAFAVDVLYLIPVALVYDRKFPVRDLVELLIFVGILSLVIIYAWKKGVFEWKAVRSANPTSPKS